MCHQKYLCKYDYLNIHLQEPRRTGFFLYVTHVISEQADLDLLVKIRVDSCKHNFVLQNFQSYWS